MKLTIGNIKFKFSNFSILLYLVLIALLISLGFWQLDRSEQKKILIEQQLLSKAKAVLKLTSRVDLDINRYRKTEITGHFDSSKQFLIDNQIVNGQVGYFVMTPFIVEATKEAVLVNRGWVKLNKNRKVLPEITLDENNRMIKGRINYFPVVGIKLEGAEIPTKGWPSVVQVVSIQVLSKKLGYTLFPFQIELDELMNDGYYRDWKTNSFMPPEKHIAYAVQWFGLAVTLTILFFGFSRKNR